MELKFENAVLAVPYGSNLGLTKNDDRKQAKVWYSDWIITRARAYPQMHYRLIVRAMRDLALSSRVKANLRSRYTSL